VPTLHLILSAARRTLAAAAVFATLCGLCPLPNLIAQGSPPPAKFHLEEATIADIHRAILAHELTATQLVKLYLARIKAYNGPGTLEPYGILGPSSFVAHAKGINALSTLNLRPAALKALGFDPHYGRSMVDRTDNDPKMPDALEVAAHLDEEFARTGKLVGPLHGVVMAIKDQYDTFDMRSTSGADAFYANDRPPDDATFVQRLRAAGAIILAKANLSDYANGTPRSSFGGAFLNPYDTERSPSGSSSGSGTSVGANLVTAAIAEETTSSVRGPAHWASAVGIAGTQELVSRAGMIQMGINTRVGPIARTVEDAARILTVIAGYDPKDELTAFSVGRVPSEPYESFTTATRLDGVRIGVVREYMDKSLFTKADEESIDLVDQAIAKLKELGATIVDPGPHGELFTQYIRALEPMLLNSTFAKQHPKEFPVEEGKSTGDQVATLVSMTVDPSLAPGKFTLRDLGANGPGGGGGAAAGGRRGGAAASGTPAGGAGGGGGAPGESRYSMDVYLARRGDAQIKTFKELLAKSQFYNDPSYPNPRARLEDQTKATVYDSAARMQLRFAVQQIILQGMADLHLDALVYPTGNIPPTKLGAPNEPNVEGRGTVWTFLGMQGFPAITVPAGFTAHVYDRVRDPGVTSTPSTEGPGAGGTTVPSHLVGPIPAVLPVGVDFLGRPFSEPVLLKIAGAYDHATHLRHPPPDFGPLPGEP